MRRLFYCCIASYIAIVSCNGLTTPPTGPGTEYPCGVWGVECVRMSTGSMCCPQDHICGSSEPFSRCPPDECCYDGDHWPDGISKDSGASDSGKAGTVYQRKMIHMNGMGQ